MEVKLCESNSERLQVCRRDQALEVKFLGCTISSLVRSVSVVVDLNVTTVCPICKCPF